MGKCKYFTNVRDEPGVVHAVKNSHQDTLWCVSIGMGDLGKLHNDFTVKPTVAVALMREWEDCVPARGLGVRSYVVLEPIVKLSIFHLVRPTMPSCSYYPTLWSNSCEHCRGHAIIDCSAPICRSALPFHQRSILDPRQIGPPFCSLQSLHPSTE